VLPETYSGPDLLRFSLPQIAECRSSQFALTFNCGSEENYKVCLIGKLPPSGPVTLLSKTHSKTCRTTTLKSFKYTEHPYDDALPLHVTPVDTRKCEQPSQYTLAFLGEGVREYERSLPTLNTTESTINHVDKIVRKGNLLKEWEQYPNPPDVLSKKPILHVPIAKRKGVYVAQYILPFGDSYERKYGPTFLYANNKAVMIDSEAEITNAFSLNGHHYLLLHHECWAGCGNLVDTLLQIRGNRVKKVLVDRTWAD
jgi:hypothetical protein